jgi:biopolymer transport protein ExbD
MIPEEELKAQRILNLAPMVDFLFLILAVFAVLAVTRTALYDCEVNLVKMDTKTPPPSFAEAKPGYTILLSINDQGQYKWVTDFNEYLLDGVASVKAELLRQQELGLLPADREMTKVLLHIDKDANWESVAKVIFAIKETGYQINPVYCPE